MATIDYYLMWAFLLITFYLWLTIPLNYETWKYHADYWGTIWGQLKELFAEVKVCKYNGIFMQWVAFATWILIACVVIFIITGLAFWLKS